MSRAFCIPGIVLLFCAFVLSLLTAISVPYLPALDIARVHLDTNSAISTGNADTFNQIRFGVWGHCEYSASNGARTCSHTGYAYSVSIGSSTDDDVQTIGASWTRGLAIHPVATIVVFIAFLLSFSTHITVTLISSMVSFLAALLTLIAFACDIALFVYVRKQVNDVDGLQADTKTGAGFWLTFVSFILLLLAGCTVCFGRRRARMSGTTATAYPAYSTSEKTKLPFWRRFRRS